MYYDYRKLIVEGTIMKHVSEWKILDPITHSVSYLKAHGLDRSFQFSGHLLKHYHLSTSPLTMCL